MLEVRKIGFVIAIIYIKTLNLGFFNFLKLDKFYKILSVLLSLSFTILLLLILNVFEANNLYDLIIFDTKKNDAAILL